MQSRLLFVWNFNALEADFRDKALAGENAGMSLVSVIGRNMGEREMDVMAAFGTPEVSPLSISVTVDATMAGDIASQIHKKIFL